MSGIQCKMHIFLDGEQYHIMTRTYVPRLGDTVRLAKGKYAKVTEVIWCFDEGSFNEDQRANIRLETEE